MNGSRKDPNQNRMPIKRTPTADEYRAQRRDTYSASSQQRRQALVMSRRFGPPAPVTPHAPFSLPSHPFVPPNPFPITPHSFAPPSSFSLPQHGFASPTPFSAPTHGFGAPSPFTQPTHGFAPPGSFPPPTPLHQPALQSTHASAPMDFKFTPSPSPATPSSSTLAPMTLPQTHAPQPTAPLTAPLTPDPGPGVPQKVWDKMLNTSATERRRDVMGLPAPVFRPSPELSNFLYDKGGPALDHQVKYGPGAGITSSDQAKLDTHYGAKTKPRLTQYSSNRQHYVDAANAAGRRLTPQEFEVGQKRDPGPTSINHVIASGTGQNLLNQMTLQFNKGKETFDSSKKGFAKSGTETDRRNAFKGIAQQAAAVGRMTAIGRAIQTEEAPKAFSSTDPGGSQGGVRDPHLRKRDTMMQNVLTAFQGRGTEARFGAYKGYLKSTFDSFGNLRLGHATGNGRVSTGLDIPLTSSMTPTARGERLYQANLNFGLPHMEAPKKVEGSGGKYRPGIFTTSGGRKLTSSTEK